MKAMTATKISRMVLVSIAFVLVAALVQPGGAGAALGGNGRCAGVDAPTGTKTDARPINSNLLERCLTLNQLQVMGSHNSYRQAMTPEIFDAVAALLPTQAFELDYEHEPLDVQFDDQGIRQIELDIFADPDGGYLAERLGLDALGLPNPTPPELLEPGFKVLHAQEIDFNTHCLTFVACLEQVEAWSDANPGHMPIAILVEMKESPIPDPLDLGFLIPIPFDAELLDAVDDEIRSVISAGDVITPDEVRRGYKTLEEAVRDGNWPSLRQSRGKVMFIMNNANLRDDYIDMRPSLEGRMMFTNSTPGQPDAAFVKVDTAPGNVEYIQSLVADGYVVRTRADTPTYEAHSGDTTRRDAALASGAQWLSTDYPVPGRSEWSDYFAEMPDGEPARCNPINTGPRCRDHLIEPG